MIRKPAVRILCAVIMFILVFGTNTFAENDTTNITAGSDKGAVKEVQQLLITTGFLAEGEDDGIYGAKTESAVRDFQGSVPSLFGITLTITGACDPETLAQLRKAAEQQISASESNTTGSDNAVDGKIPDSADPALIEELAGYEKIFDDYISYLKHHPIDDDDSSSYSSSESDDDKKKVPETKELTERSDAVSEYISAYSSLRKVAKRDLSDEDRVYYNEFKTRIDQKLSDAGIG